MSEEITVDNVDQAVEFLFDQATRGNLEDELGEQFAAEEEQRREARVLS